MKFNRLTMAVLVCACFLCASLRSAEQLSAATWGWGENIGWVTVVEGGEDAALVHDGFLSGFLLGESAGWIHLGDGTPENGLAYSNASATD